MKDSHAVVLVAVVAATLIIIINAADKPVQ